MLFMEAIPRYLLLSSPVRASIAPSKNLTIICIFISIKVFLSVTKHESEAVEQQGEVQNDGSLSLVAPSSFKRRNSRLQNLRQNAESTGRSV